MNSASNDKTEIEQVQHGENTSARTSMVLDNSLSRTALAKKGNVTYPSSFKTKNSLGFNPAP